MLVTTTAIQELAETALDRAMGEILEGRRPFVPFVMTERAGEREFHRFATERLEQSTGAARHFLRASTGYDRALLCWDGYVTVGNGIGDAVMVEVSEAGAGTSLIFARRYRSRLLRSTLAVPGTIAVGEGHPLF
ncbi:hypothetical protein [Homoserinibacter sp. YIM 151385]|uniref:hypothetical protein n=1 Tax=Homoserinibacter sp. YIM 151385 TaxID=2985506 RepID=UPI0022F00B11|nr:hypothetical protein [Homoserinibacter sp. YIM 151385]WBU37140.1 hypothetical protein OF852_09415 [Homoserinibacter sp. YIM 151385]